MYNPLLGDPSKLKDTELEERVIELSKKYQIAARTGMNQVIPQILTALGIYREEMSKRSAAALQAATKKNNNGNLDDLINIE